MPRFFTAEVNGDKIITTGEDARHIGYSLRMKIGDEITFCSGGFEYICKIKEMNGLKSDNLRIGQKLNLPK